MPRPKRYGAALVLGNTVGLILLLLGAMGLGAYRDAVVDHQFALIERQADLGRSLIEHDRVCGGAGCFENPGRTQQVLLDATAGFGGRVALFQSVG
ncbi:MAG: hypothetical protein AAF511_12465, partial [Pseudomonadota bacterium]